MVHRAEQGPASGRGPPEEPEAEQLVSAPEGRPVSREDPVLWPSSFGTGKAEASMRTSPFSQGPNTPGSKGVRPGFPGRAKEPGLLQWVDLGWLGPAGVRWVMRGSGNGCFWVVSHSITRSQQRPILLVGEIAAETHPHLCCDPREGLQVQRGSRRL